ncbi:MAG: GtrA family protein [Candidatus Eremiobacteraeota bacterium]|nr:GtrA family protein [Candidatus Eremiobacteraeota bacterium]MBV9646665.1 GtrA family protein [Candidatus Eremiobacteraeota bacterium]
MKQGSVAGQPGIVTRLAQRRGVRQFVKFGIVGASGLIVNLIVFTVLQKTTTLPFWLLFSIGFMVGGVSNYFLNRVWTFRSEGHAAKEGAQFLLVSFAALLVGNLTGWFLKSVLGVHHDHTVWFLSTLSGMLLNFFVNKYWTFRSVL